MRWLLLFLIVLNAVVLFWFGQQQKIENAAGDTVSGSVTSGAPGIVLLSELPREKIRYKTVEVKKEDTAADVAPPAVAVAPVTADSDASAPPKPAEVVAPPVAARPVDKDSCGFLGPFAEAITVRQVVGRLKRAQVDAKMYGEAARINPIYWVYLRAAPSRSVALETLRKLHASRIDAFIVAEGEDINAISLGFFTRKASAESIRQERIAQGFDAKLVLKERQREQFWAVVAPQSREKLEESLIANLRAEYGEFTRRSRKCSVVASFTQFE